MSPALLPGASRSLDKITHNSPKVVLCPPNQSPEAAHMFRATLHFHVSSLFSGTGLQNMSMFYLKHVSNPAAVKSLIYINKAGWDA